MKYFAFLRLHRFNSDFTLTFKFPSSDMMDEFLKDFYSYHKSSDTDVKFEIRIDFDDDI